MANLGHALMPKPITAVRGVNGYPDWQALSHGPTPEERRAWSWKCWEQHDSGLLLPGDGRGAGPAETAVPPGWGGLVEAPPSFSCAVILPVDTPVSGDLSVPETRGVRSQHIGWFRPPSSAFWVTTLSWVSGHLVGSATDSGAPWCLRPPRTTHKDVRNTIST